MNRSSPLGASRGSMALLPGMEQRPFSANYTLGNISLNRKPDLAHYSPGVEVLAWQRQRCLL